MKTWYRAPISTVVAILVGSVVLLGAFIQTGLISDLRTLFLKWAVPISAVVLLAGVINLIKVHWGKFTHQKKGGGYSLLLIIALMLTVIIVGYSGPTGSWSVWIFEYIQLPVESSLMAILAVILLYTLVNLLRRRLNIFTGFFLITVLVMLVGAAPLLGMEIPGLYGQDSLHTLLSRIPSVAGGRGILLGVALGAIATGIRVILGVDRPYGG